MIPRRRRYCTRNHRLLVLFSTLSLRCDLQFSSLHLLYGSPPPSPSPFLSPTGHGVLQWSGIYICQSQQLPCTATPIAQRKRIRRGIYGFQGIQSQWLKHDYSGRATGREYHYNNYNIILITVLWSRRVPWYSTWRGRYMVGRTRWHVWE